MQVDNLGLLQLQALFFMTQTQKILSNWSSAIAGPVFYLPVLGPVFLPEGKEKVLQDLIDNANKDSFLPYDKNKRWYAGPPERILVEEIYSSEEYVLVPVINQGKLKIFYYSENSLNQVVCDKIIKFSQELNEKGDYKKVQLFVFDKPEVEKEWDCHNIYIQKFKNSNHSDLTRSYQELSPEIQKTFQLLGGEEAMEGFGFLWKEYLEKGKLLSKILCSVENNTITGAIGPLDVWQDGNNRKFLLPPYFGVRSPWRGKGVSVQLWQSAMNYALENGAEYTLVQNKPSSRAAEFYEGQGLENAEQVYSIEL